MAHPKYLVAVAICLSLIGCDQATLVKKWTKPEDELRARNYVDLLRQGKLDQVIHDLDPSVANSNVRDTFLKMAALFPNESPESVKVIGVHVFHGPEYSATSMTLEYQFPSKWILVDLTTKQAEAVTTIVGFHVSPLSDSLENLNKFTIVGKNPTQYLMLILAACFFVFSLYALILCIRTTDGKKKWIWALLALVGVGSLGVNWTTGQFTFAIFSVHIPCAAATQPLYGPWTVEVFLPVGAVLALRWRRRMMVARQSMTSRAQETYPEISGSR